MGRAKYSMENEFRYVSISTVFTIFVVVVVITNLAQCFTHSIRRSIVDIHRAKRWENDFKFVETIRLNESISFLESSGTKGIQDQINFDDLQTAVYEEISKGYDSAYSTPYNCVQSKYACSESPIIEQLELDSYQNYIEFDSPNLRTNLSLTKVTQLGDAFQITMYSNSGPKNYGNDWMLTFSQSERHSVVSHKIIDHKNGSYQIYQHCRVDSKEPFKLFIRIEKTAEQLEFFRRYKNSFRTTGGGHRIKYNKHEPGILCAASPW